MLDIPEAMLSDNGVYECQALLNSREITVPTLMGYLTVIGKDEGKGRGGSKERDRERHGERYG